MNPQINRKHDAARIALATAAVLCLALAPVAAAQEVAQVRAGSSAIDFSPVVANGGLVLTVSGPDGFHHRTEFGSGESPAFSIFDEAGGVLPDGVYNYELTAVPTQTQRREAFEANRLSARSGGIEPMVQSGAFSIVGGAVVAGGEEEPGAGPGVAGGNRLGTKDQVIPDDLIVQGSICVGFDCANNENFGFDTIRLKENNLRIKFEDTSAGSFPSVDWELQANDSVNGGQSWFRVNDVSNGTSPFTVEADTPSHTLYVDSAKRVGVGTSTPAVQLHVKDGNSPTLRLEQDTSAGFAAQIWDVAGNEANFFVRSASTGSQLPFRIRPGAPTSSIDIAASGNIGIGTASPDADADVTVESGESAAILMKKAGAVRFRMNNTTAATDWDVNNDGSGDFSISLVGTGQNDFEIEQDGDIGNCTNPDHDFVISTGPGCTATPRSWIDAGDSGFSTTSSRTLKEHLVPLAADGIVEKVAAIPVYQFDFIEGPKDRIGLMAEEFHSIFGRGSDKEISSHEMQVAMWLAIQELAATNDRLERELERLKQGK